MDKSQPTRLNFAKLFFVLPLFFTSSCTTNYYVDKNTYSDKTNYAREIVYVTNPEHVDYAALKDAAIYPLSATPNEKTSLTLQPKTLRSIPMYCEIGVFMTLGLIPEKCPYEEEISYKLKHEDREETYRHKLTYYSRISIWETFLIPFRNSQGSIKAQSLMLSNREEN